MDSEEGTLRSPQGLEGGASAELGRFLEVCSPGGVSGTLGLGEGQTPPSPLPAEPPLARAELVWMRHAARPHRRRPGVKTTHPTTGQVGVFPLHRAGLGQLWLDEGELQGWSFELAGTHIPQVIRDFSMEVGYPVEYLREAVQAVVRGSDSLGGGCHGRGGGN